MYQGFNSKFNGMMFNEFDIIEFAPIISKISFGKIMRRMLIKIEERDTFGMRGSYIFHPYGSYLIGVIIKII